jgi:magnesium transporter
VTDTDTTDGQSQVAPVLNAWYWSPDGQLIQEQRPNALKEIANSGQGSLWVDIDSSDRRQVALLEHVFNFHPLAIEDVLNPSSRVKLEEYPEHLFAIIRGVRFCEETPEDPYDIETHNLYFFLTRNVLVTAHAEHVPSIEVVKDRLARSPGLLERGPARMMHGIMDAAIDEFFPIIDELDTFVDELEERVFVDFDRTVMRDIFSVKRLVLSLRRHLIPEREVFNVLTNRPNPLLATETQIYFRDIYDHVLRITESLDSFRDLLSGTQDAYLSQVSNRLGSVTKALSVIATLSLPFLLVSGMWGMNFGSIPLSAHPMGFCIMLVVQVAIGILLLAVLRWRKLL